MWSERQIFLYILQATCNAEYRELYENMKLSELFYSVSKEVMDNKIMGLETVTKSFKPFENIRNLVSKGISHLL